MNRGNGGNRGNKGKRPLEPNSDSNVEDITDEVMRLARTRGISTDEALRLLAQRPGPSSRQAQLQAVRRVLESRNSRGI